MDVRRLAWMSILIVALTSISVLALPFGAQVSEESDSRASADAAQNNSAFAGNVTELTITGFSITQSWQGYFGNVSGTIQLADASDNIFYNWSLASPQGEIYATNSTAITWTNIQCFNFTADGSLADDTAQRGGTSFFGKNMTQLEDEFGINNSDKDGVNETFSLTGSHESGRSFTHSPFYTNSLQFGAGECVSTHTLMSNGAIEDASFEEVILYDPDNEAVVFASILDQDVIGFDDNSHDFQMLVLEDGHGTNLATTTYFFYVELE